MHRDVSTKWITYTDCGLGANNPVITSETRLTDDDATRTWIEINYQVKGPDKPIANVALTLECFGTAASYADDSRYDFKFSIYNDQPKNATAELIQLGVPRIVGHTYFGLERTDNQTGEVVRKVMGFYPQNKWTSLSSLNVASTWGDDAQTPYDQSVSVDLTSEQFYNVIGKLSGPDVQTTYNITGTGGKNCTTMAKYLAGDYIYNLPGGMGVSPFGWMYNPADFGQDIMSHKQAIEGQPGVTVSYGMQISPPSTKCKLNR